MTAYVLEGFRHLEPKARLDYIRRSLHLPDRTALFYAFGAPREEAPGRSRPRSDRVLCDDETKGWWSDYCNDPQRHAVDPVRAAIRTSFAPVYWNKLLAERDFERSTDVLWQHLRDHRISAGISVPIHDAAANRYGSFSLIHFEQRGVFEDWLARFSGNLAGAAYALHLSFGAITPATSLLSPRERECLALISEGLTSKQIASRLGLSPKTIDLHIASACRRLDAMNRSHAVARALETGALDASSRRH
ncbi:helix-turn-helix transcriptional regulator [Ruegeria marina]|uniref:LuxR family transcriptional regulator n=1 Tax=Ruegeria marina TaxID=639004 RepID=A0A1G7E2L7_9RHOB|nr:LuxR family transcriptional regulator [Ruegeria marina]SDE57953.1 LuxR family transcriptional regulator [Ruegeria marina]